MLKQIKYNALPLTKPEQQIVKKKTVAELQAQLREMISYCYRYEHEKIPDAFVKLRADPKSITDVLSHCTAARLSQCIDYMESYYKNPEKHHEKLDKAKEACKKLSSFYGSLPYGTMIGKEEFYPLFSVRYLIENMEKNLDYKGTDLDLLNRYRQSIILVLEIYIDSVANVTKELNDAGYCGAIEVPLLKPAASQLRPKENDPAKLKDEMDDLGKYYFANMAPAAELIRGGYYLSGYDDVDRRNRIKKDALIALNAINAAYGTIPFASLHGNENYYPLFVCRKILQMLDKTARAYYAKETKPEQQEYEELGLLIYSFNNVGGQYDEPINALSKRIRSCPGYEETKHPKMDVVARRMWIHDFAPDFWETTKVNRRVREEYEGQKQQGRWPNGK